MKTKKVLALLLALLWSPACQFLRPAQTGTLISECAEIVSAVAKIQAVELPDHLMETAIKRGDELDLSQYFDVLTHVSMREGYALDYIYQNDGLGGYPLLYARPQAQAPYASAADIPANTPLPDFRDYVDVEDVERGYFEFAVLDLMADQFYLFWHANYNDDQIVCNREQLNEIVTDISSGDFGIAMDVSQQARARAIKNIEPSVRLTGDVATVQFVTFTKWGGFYRETYTIRRESPHTIVDMRQENIVPYDCGVAF